MAESKKGHNFAIQEPTEKIRVRLFCVLMLYIKFQVPRSIGSLVLQTTKGVTDRRTDRWTGPNQYAPPQLLRSWGYKNDKIGKNRCYVFLNCLIVFCSVMLPL